MATEPPGVHIAGGELRKLRKLAGLTLIPFAEQVGISFQYLSQIERGDRTSVSPEVFAKICDALHLADRSTLVATRPLPRQRRTRGRAKKVAA